MANHQSPNTGAAFGTYTQQPGIAASLATAASSHTAPLWKLPTVLRHFPVSRSAWLAGVKSGRYPAPVRLSARSVAWRSADVLALVDSL